jgi:hypothetical protein
MHKRHPQNHISAIPQKGEPVPARGTPAPAVGLLRGGNRYGVGIVPETSFEKMLSTPVESTAVNT